MGLASFIRASIRLLKFAKKPGRNELWLSIKICFLGVVAVGLTGFIIYLLASLIRGMLLAGV